MTSHGMTSHGAEVAEAVGREPSPPCHPGTGSTIRNLHLPAGGVEELSRPADRRGAGLVDGGRRGRPPGAGVGTGAIVAAVAVGMRLGGGGGWSVGHVVSS